MFDEFFYLLRQYGLDVSTTEWLTVQQALSLGLHRSSLTGFYDLCRAILCKSESEYDKFDQAFEEFFYDVFYTATGRLRDDLPEDVVVLRQPLDHIYLVSTSVMDLFVHLDALDSIALSGTKAEGWYVEEAKQAMQEGRIAYAGKYSAPDYERILAAGCTLAIENTMVLHDPEVKEQLEKFGVPVLVERSSYESGPLARMEWLKLYGILLNKTEMAEEVFRQKVEQVAPILEQENTGKTAAFFSITTNNLITVRKGGDYVAQMIGMAGGSYVFADLTDNGNSLATMNLPLEDFYAGAKDADVLIYNSAIEGMIASVSQLTERFPLLNEFKAVQNGQVWCTTQSLFQQSMELADLIVDMNRVFTKGTPAASTLKFLTHVD